MNKIKVLVVEDEMIIADNICKALTALGYEALEPVINYTDAIIAIEQEAPDIAILDIQLSGEKTGIDIATEIRKKYDFPFIFLTSNADTATVSQAKKTLPPAYLVKPFTKDELYTAIEIALYNYSIKSGNSEQDDIIINNALFIKSKGIYHKITFDEITYLKADHVYTELKLEDEQSFTVRTSLNTIIAKLSSKFIRTHKSYIVNTDYLKQIGATELTINNEVIPLGKTFRKGILEKVNIA